MGHAAQAEGAEAPYLQVHVQYRLAAHKDVCRRWGRRARAAHAEAQRGGQAVWGPLFPVQSEPVTPVSLPRRTCGRRAGGAGGARTGAPRSAQRVLGTFTGSLLKSITVVAQEDGRAAGQAALGERAQADRVARKVYWVPCL